MSYRSEKTVRRSRKHGTSAASAGPGFSRAMILCECVIGARARRPDRSARMDAADQRRHGAASRRQRGQRSRGLGERRQRHGRSARPTADARGRRWPSPAAETLDFRDVDAVSERTAYALSIGPGDASRIYKTTDAGTSWRCSSPTPIAKAFFDAMAFWDAERGIAFSDSVDGTFVILTHDRRRAHVDARARQTVCRRRSRARARSRRAAPTSPCSARSDVWIGTTAGRVLRLDRCGPHMVDRGDSGVDTGECDRHLFDRFSRCPPRHRRRRQLPEGSGGGRQRRA